MKRFLLSAVLLFMVVGMASAYKQLKRVEINVNGSVRNMEVFVPDVLPENSPLMIITHGMNQDPEYQMGSDHFYEMIDTAKFVVVYPRSNGSTWDTGGTNDMNFIIKIIDEMAAQYSIDTNRVYWSGFSMGSMLIYHCMAQMQDRIAAFAPTSGIQFSESPWNACKKPVNLIQCHAYDDTVFGYAEYGIRDYVMHFATMDKTTDYKKKAGYRIFPNLWYDGDLEIWSGGENGSEVALYSYNNGGHWPMNDNRHLIWAFCKRFSLDEGAPTGKIISPETTDNYCSADTIPIKIQAKDKDGYISSIMLYIDDRVKAKANFTEVSESGVYELDYTWVRPTAAKHTIKAVITDNDKKSRTISRAVTIAKPEPLKLLSLDPENDSFDLPLSQKVFTFIYDLKVDLSRMKAQFIGAGSSVDLIKSDTLLADTFTLTVPDDFELQEGAYKLYLSNVYDQRNVKASNSTLNYYYGYTAVDETSTGKTAPYVYKGKLLKALQQARDLYEATAGEEYKEQETLRSALLAVVDSLTAFASTSPTQYDLAVATIMDVIAPLQTRKDNLDAYYKVRAEAEKYIEMFANDESVNTTSAYTRLIKAYTNYELDETQKQKDSKIISYTEGIQRYIDNFIEKNAEAIAASISTLKIDAENVKSIEYFDLSGARVLAPTRGIYAERITLKNGKQTTKKVLIK